MLNYIKEYIQEVLEGFDLDPSDSLFQEGYLAAITELKYYIDAKESQIQHD